MDKNQVVTLVKQELENQLRIAVSSANAAHSTATHSESVAENKYDTFGLEASYLAHGQSERVEQLKASIDQLNGLVIKGFDESEAVELSALVELEDAQGNLSYVFIAPSGGGVKVQIEDKIIVVVTPLAPLGKALIGKYVEDEIVLTPSKDAPKTITHLW